MAATYYVGSTPDQLLFGSQTDVVTVVNTGASTVYIGDDSAVVTSQVTPLDVGGSIVFYPGQVLWAATAAGTNSTLTLFNSVGDRFAYGTTAGAFLGTNESYGAAGNSLNVGFPWDKTMASQYKAVSIGLTASGLLTATGTWTITWWDYDTPTSGFVGIPGYGRKQEVQINIRNTIGISSPSSFAGVVFPVYGFGGEYQVTPPAAAGAGQWSVSVYGLPTAPPQPIPWGLVDNSFDATYTWTRYGNAWICNVGNVAASATIPVFTPPVPSPVRIGATYTQTGAGVSQIGLRLGNFSGAPTNMAFDTLLASSTAAGSVQGFATYGVFPTTSNYFQIQTVAGVTLSSTYLYIMSGLL